jgi:hypothetical protein
LAKISLVKRALKLIEESGEKVAAVKGFLAAGTTTVKYITDRGKPLWAVVNDRGWR